MRLHREHFRPPCLLPSGVPPPSPTDPKQRRQGTCPALADPRKTTRKRVASIKNKDEKPPLGLLPPSGSSFSDVLHLPATPPQMPPPSSGLCKRPRVESEGWTYEGCSKPSLSASLLFPRCPTPSPAPRNGAVSPCTPRDCSFKVTGGRQPPKSPTQPTHS